MHWLYAVCKRLVRVVSNFKLYNAANAVSFNNTKKRKKYVKMLITSDAAQPKMSTAKKY